MFDPDSHEHAHWKLIETAADVGNAAEALRRAAGRIGGLAYPAMQSSKRAELLRSFADQLEGAAEQLSEDASSIETKMHSAGYASLENDDGD